MNKTERRHMFILETIAKEEKIEVTKLAKMADVSLVTMRKDLATLEQQRLLHREQGYASIDTHSVVGKRLLTNYAVKKEIAQAAAKLVNDGDTVFIESGSCCNILAAELAKTKKRIHIITNSVFMSTFIGDQPNVHLLLTGGDYEPGNMVMLGPVTKTCINQFHVRLFFSGIDGYIPGTGFSGEDLQHVEVVQAMESQSDKTVILVESSKYDHSGLVTLLRYDQVDYLFTDCIPDASIEKEILSHNIKITKTKASD